MNSKILSVMAVLIMCVPAFACVDVSAEAVSEPVSDDIPDEREEYVRGEILVKSAFFDAGLLNVPYISEEPVFPGSHWHKVVLSDGVGTLEALDAVRASGAFEAAELNRVHTLQTVDVSGNPSVSRSEYLDVMGIREAWGILESMGVSPGGDRTVVIAVLDTGVDYNHEDLKGNIWVNTDEIPDNGIDDDGNGYVDDTIGWNFVSGNNDPMDDQGHGTHVAGIIGSENNTVGTVGVAFNCQIMCIKSGNAAGKFTSAQIAAGIFYAADNGAQAINLSIGGASSEGPITDALADTKDRCIAVAAAGNSSLCSDRTHAADHPCGPSYPGASPYTIGVMSATKDGTERSWFSNYDHVPFDDVEYDTYGAGSEILSTWPNNRYATLNGTSMACPVVTGIVALVLSSNTDREQLTLNMVRAAVVNAGSIHPYNDILGEVDQYHVFCDAVDALIPDMVPFIPAKSPHYLERSSMQELDPSLSPVPAGTKLLVTMDYYNRGFTAFTGSFMLESDDPYLLFEPVGFGRHPVNTYETVPYDPQKEGYGSFEVRVSPDCPDGHVIKFGIVGEWYYGEPSIYGTWTRECSFTVENSENLPSVISGDSVFTSDRSYILPESLTIAEGANVTFESGCRIVTDGDCRIDILGSLSLAGTPEDRIKFGGHARDTVSVELAGAAASFSAKDCDIVRTAFSVGEGADIGDMSFLRCGIDAVSCDAESMDIGGLTDSSFSADCQFLRFGDVDGSVITLTDTFDLEFIGSAVKDSILIPNIYGFQYGSVLFGSDVYGLMVADTGHGDIGECTFSAAEGVTLDGLCFESGYRGTDDVPSVPLDKADVSGMWPMIIGAQLLEEDGSVPEKVQNKDYTLRLELSVPMDADVPLRISWADSDGSFSSDVKGAFVSDTVWEGRLNLSKVTKDITFGLRTEGGADAVSAHRSTVPSFDCITFVMETIQEANVWVEPSADCTGAEVWFFYPDYMKAMGYNVYRSDSADGEMVKLNENPVLPEFVTYTDSTVTAGCTYWYTITWLDLDMNESEPQDRAEYTVPQIILTSPDRPTSGHSLRFSCTVFGDFAETGVTFSYRTDSGWKEIVMQSVGGEYVCTIYADEVLSGTFSYVITVTDAQPGQHAEFTHTMSLGSRNDPLTLDVQPNDDLTVLVAALALLVLAAALFMRFGRR